LKPFALIAAAGWLLAGCPGKDVELLPPGADGSDHGQAALIAAVESYNGKPATPAGYRAFALEIDGLRPIFNEEVGEFADMYLSFLALPILEAQLDRPRDQQLEALALTVFPTAFGVEPRAGEAVRDYLLRLCGESKPLECREYAPEGWPLILSAKVRRTMKHRAQGALDSCSICGERATYVGILEKFDTGAAKEDALAAEHEDEYDPHRWPMSGESAAPWSGAPLFALVDGDALLDGAPLPSGAWHPSLTAARHGTRVLGVHLTPSTQVRTLRVLATDATRAGYHELALQVRDRRFPYTLGEYRIALRGAAPRLDTRDIDTIQILARALDLTRSKTDRPPRL